ncbi:hypothetical protein ACJ2A9_07785 [Anaerobacillus sp. MEB173]|uniref:hypothetical protein n=1 Tax=Anaerobacillus sp. MEB173 TaxID=3383345 RepID=UPI003F931D56
MTFYFSTSNNNGFGLRYKKIRLHAGVDQLLAKLLLLDSTIRGDVNMTTRQSSTNIRFLWPIALMISLPIFGYALFGGGGIFIGAAFAIIGVIQWMKKDKQKKTDS